MQKMKRRKDNEYSYCTVGRSYGGDKFIALRSFDEAEKYNEIGRIYGSLNGIEGILNDNLIDLKEVLITENDKQLLKRTPSTVLGSCRFKLKNSSDDDSDYKRITQTFAKYDIKAFFYIGGNDSMDTVMKLDAYFRENHIDIKVVGVPKTIDNDLPLTDHTPRFRLCGKIMLRQHCRKSSVTAGYTPFRPLHSRNNGT